MHVGEFVIGGTGKVGCSYDSKNKKVVCAVELADQEIVMRMCALKIENFSSNELKKIFTRHISTTATITTDCWEGYRPLMQEYDIEQVGKLWGMYFRALHTMVHQIK